MKTEKKIITIHQPDFFPWIGFFQRWQKSDLFIILDDVQFIRRGWHHRDKIKTLNGARWLTVPVEKKGRYFQPINKVKTSISDNWKKQHLDTIYAAYKDAPRFEFLFPEIETLYSKSFAKLIDINLTILNFVSTKLEITTPVTFASDLNIPSKGTDKLLQLIKKVDGTDYLTGLGSKNYLEETKLTDEGINVVWDDFAPPYYNQLHNGFIPGLSILDMLMMMETDEIIKLLPETM